MTVRPRHHRQERPSRGEGGAPRRPRPARKPWLPVIPPTPTQFQLCALNPRPLEAADAVAVFTANVLEVLREITAPTDTLVGIERDAHNPLYLTLIYESSIQASKAEDRIRNFRVAQGSYCFRVVNRRADRVLLVILGSRVLADLEHPDGAGREPDLDDTLPPDEDDDGGSTSTPAAPVVYAHRTVNPYAGPATRQALVTDGPVPPRFGPRTQAYMNGGAQ
jgi:hypothetical protein